jgi:hypothetical protein
MSSKPPDGLPVYRLLTGKDDASFCRRVSEAIELGYVLYGSPSLTFNGNTSWPPKRWFGRTVSHQKAGGLATRRLFVPD